MREKEVMHPMEDVRGKFEIEDLSSECLKNGTNFRSNGAVPHQSQPSACSPGTYPGLLDSGIKKVLVTGGGGYVGHNLGCILTQSGISVVLFDTKPSEWETPKGATFFQGDIRNYDSLYNACQDVDCIFHLASFGMSGSQQLQKELIESINIGGTKVVINVCCSRNIPRLIYTSTVNVVFGGIPIKDGDEETTTYFPLDKHISHYSRSKAIADQMVLAANGTALNGGGKLHTCVLRSSAIYGQDERRHFPRIIANVKRSLVFFKFGSKDAKMNWVHLSNLIEAQILAAEALTPYKAHVASGQAYYIHDGENVNVFEWFHPLFEKLGYSDPWIHIPYSLVYGAAIILEFLHLAIKPFLEINPMLTRYEVMNAGVMYTFRIDKARKDLGYNPKKFFLADIVKFYELEPSKPQHFWQILCVVGFCIFIYIFFVLFL
ncbi:putative short-chain dehydrogenase/reductase family 42E member 2 [Bombina bombina]|uniref:putative short-chain dehydrogenase/reductase family 42E member 2 n=1 Tax=Bombina bombina TaxID=8345 RepID=UPI00235AF87C|nr:putative short-chain dehydrogenase/reductase family 42E member 2 [Bombina bombina]